MEIKIVSKRSPLYFIWFDFRKESKQNGLKKGLLGTIGSQWAKCYKRLTDKVIYICIYILFFSKDFNDLHAFKKKRD